MKEFFRAVIWLIVTAAIAKKICGAELATPRCPNAAGTVSAVAQTVSKQQSDFSMFITITR